MDDVTPRTILLEGLNLGGILSALIVVAVTWFVVGLVTGSLTRLGVRMVDRRLLINQIATVARFMLWVIGGVLAVRALNLSREVILAMTGAAAVTIGFALKDLAASVLAGLTILIDRPFQVGDRVSFSGYYGEITAIGLRSIRLTTLDDNLVTIPNNKFLTELVSSGNAGALDMLIQMDFYIGLDQDVTLAKRLVSECMQSSLYIFTDKPWTVLVNQVLENNYPAIRLRAKAYVLDVRYEKSYETDVTERVLQAFAEHGVLPPRVLVDWRDGATPPARLVSRPRATG
ncbi:MAG: mechanosensitive ion channel [Myxococcales bacterium]|nr:mechanosensitive ion channel [Myxococcales bacterium]MCB9756553.1 mechanosensitive ion channel [Myxococcales bacterium]